MIRVFLPWPHRAAHPLQYNPALVAARPPAGQGKHLRHPPTESTGAGPAERGQPRAGPGRPDPRARLAALATRVRVFPAVCGQRTGPCPAASSRPTGEFALPPPSPRSADGSTVCGHFVSMTADPPPGPAAGRPEAGGQAVLRQADAYKAGPGPRISQRTDTRAVFCHN